MLNLIVNKWKILCVNVRAMMVTIGTIFVAFGCFMCHNYCYLIGDDECFLAFFLDLTRDIYNGQRKKPILVFCLEKL